MENESENQPIRVVSIDDHALIREAIQRILDPVEGIELVGQGVNGRAVYELTQQHQPDVAIVDLQMPMDQEGGQRFQATVAIRKLSQSHPETKIIILSQHWIASLTSLVAGYLLKDDDLSLKLTEAIQVVHSGGEYRSRLSGQAAVDQGLISLTERQMAVLQVMADHPDRSSSEWAKTLQVSENTLRSHQKRIYQILGVQRAQAAILKAMRLGLLPLLV